MQAELGELVVDCNGIEIYENDFEFAISEAFKKENIDDLRAAKQGPWQAVMRDVGKTIFSNNNMLRDKDTVILEGNNIPTNNNRFDYNIINILLEYYIYLSDRYDKLVSTEAFSLFINVPRETIARWKQLEPSTSRNHIYKKIDETRLKCILNHAYDNGNVTGTMYVGNVEYQTNLPGVSREQVNKRALTANELPKLSENNTQLIQDNSLIPTNEWYTIQTQFKNPVFKPFTGNYWVKFISLN